MASRHAWSWSGQECVKCGVSSTEQNVRRVLGLRRGCGEFTPERGFELQSRIERAAWLAAEEVRR